MSHKRMRVWLKFTLLFVIGTGLSAALAQRPGWIVVFAPRPDDEVIGCAGIIMQALARAYGRGRLPRRESHPRW